MDFEVVEQVNEDHICVVCLTIFYRPLKLNCGHLFCQPCLDRLCRSELKVCPLCRAPFSEEEMKPDLKMWSVVMSWYPEEIEKREKSILENKSRQCKILVESTSNLMNVSESSQRSFHRWTLHVKMANGGLLQEYASWVQIKLHPTFNPPVYQFQANEVISLTKIGWGTFPIEIKIHWKQEYGGFSALTYKLEWVPRKYCTYTCKL